MNLLARAAWLLVLGGSVVVTGVYACSSPYATDGGDTSDASSSIDGSAEATAADAAPSGSDAGTDACAVDPTTCVGDSGALALGVSATSRLVATETDIFWSDPTKKVVSQVSVGGGASIVLGSGQALSGDLAIQGTSVYFTGQETVGTWALYRAQSGVAVSATKIGSYAGLPQGLALDTTYAYVFQAGVGANLILAAVPLDGAPLQAMIQTDPSDKGLVALGGNVWWTLPSSGWVVTVNKLARLDGGVGGPVVANDTQPGADLLFTAGSKMFWANLGVMPYLIRTAPAGNNVSSTVAPAPTKPVSLVTDAITAYWADGIDTIWSAPTDGSASAATKLATGLSQPGAMALTSQWVVVLERGRGAIVLLPR